MAKDTSPSKEIDAIIKNAEDWKGKKLARLRAIIKKADPVVVEEVKWKKPSKPEGVAVWEHDGILCNADILKNTLRLTFHKGAQMKDPKKQFNTRLESTVARGIDYAAEDSIDEPGLKALIVEAVRVNSRVAQERAKKKKA
jgi:hypothetical protein